MKTARASLAFFFAVSAVAAAAQDGNGLVKRGGASTITNVDREKLLACTLSRHPEETKRYAQYHLQRRGVQTPERNEADPDSRLFLPALEGCFEVKVGEAFPFSPDQLIAGWGAAHNVAAAVVVEDMPSLAKCVVLHNPSGAKAYSQYLFDGSERSAKVRRMLMYAMVEPPCVGTGSLSIDHDRLGKLIVAAFSAQRVSN